MLFTTITEINNLVESNAGINFLSLQPSIAAAESKFIKPLFGNAFLSEVINYYQGTIGEGGNTDQILATVVALAQPAIANLALYMYVPIAEAQLSDAGVRRGHTQDSPGAYKYQVKELQQAYLDRGFQYIEELIEYLEANLSETSLASWVESAEFKRYRRLFIRTGGEFEQLVTYVRFPKRLYSLLRSEMYNIQELSVEKSISSELYADLIEKATKVDKHFSAEDIILVDLLKNAIAHMTIAKGMIALLATMDENGIHVLSNNADSSSEVGKRTSASDNVLDAMIRGASLTGEKWMTKAIDYLNKTASATVFIPWYTLLNTTPTETISVNQNLSGSFSL